MGPVQFHWCRWASEGTDDAAGQGHRRARGVREPPRPLCASLAGWKARQVCRVPRGLPTSSRLRGEHGARASSDQARSGCRTAGSSGSCLAGPQFRCRPSALAGTLAARSPRVTGQGHTSQAFAGCGLWETGRLPCVSPCRPARSSLLRPTCFWTVPMSPSGQRGTLAAADGEGRNGSHPRAGPGRAERLESSSRGQPGTPRLLGPDGGRLSVALGERVGLAGRPSRALEAACPGPPSPANPRPLLVAGPAHTRVHPSLVPEMTAVPAVWTPCSELGGPWLTCLCWVVPAGRGSFGLGPQDLEARGPRVCPVIPCSHGTPPRVLRPAQRVCEPEAARQRGQDWEWDVLGPLSSGTPVLPRLSVETWSQDPVGAQRQGRVTPVAWFLGRSARVSLCA